MIINFIHFNNDLIYSLHHDIIMTSPARCAPELPMVTVSYSGPHQDQDNINPKTTAEDCKQDTSKALSKIKVVGRRAIQTFLRSPSSPAEPTFKSYLQQEGEEEEEEPVGGSTHSIEALVPSVSASARARRGVANEAGNIRGAELRMRRHGSDDENDDASSHTSTVKPLGQDPSVPSLDDLLALHSTTKHLTLTMSGVQAFTKSEAGKQKGYLRNHEPSWPAGERNREERGVCVGGWYVCMCVCMWCVCGCVCGVCDVCVWCVAW